MLNQYPKSALSLALVGLFATASAHAIEIETDNPDLNVRFDNTVRYNVGQRIENRDPKIGNAPLSDEGTYSFDKNDVVSSRLDLLTELDVVYKGTMGFRVSAAGWYDDAHDGNSHSNPRLANISNYRNNRYSDYVNRYYGGPSGEILDAFVFGSFDLADVTTRVKAGRHSLYWGESIFLGGNVHSVAYSQSGIDLQKGFSVPGSEAKELFRPLNQISTQTQLTNTLSVAAQYLFQWESARFSEGGTYLGAADATFYGPDRQFVTTVGTPPNVIPVFANRGPAVNPSESGEYGVSARWSPEWLDGTMGFYYRNFADKLPQILLTQGAPAPRYNMVFADNIDLYGVSLSKNIAGVSVGAEMSYRHNTPLNTVPFAPVGSVPARGETKGARGDTWHALINGVGSISKTPVFDSATWVTELTYSRWDKVTSGANFFQAEGFAPCNGRDKSDGCTTKDFVGLGAAFTPTWFQVFPGVDLSAPLNFSIGLMGNAPTVFGGNEDAGNYSVGLSADIQQKYRVDLKYIDYMGRYKDNGQMVTAVNGLTTYLKDRGFISLTLKTTF